MRTHAQSVGYTAIEVMISLTLLGVGAAGVISMQRGTIQGVAHARNLDTANAIAHTWLERLRADATQWTRPSAEEDTVNDFTSTRFFSRGGTNMTDANWYLPDQGMNVGMSPAFDMLGRDLTYTTNPTATSPTVPEIMFCTHVKVDCLVRTATSSGAPTTCSLMRAQVRVFWPKGIVAVRTGSFCEESNTPVIANPDDFHFLYVVSAIRQNKVQ
jgi:Tfp pilus assembly protein PilV